MTAGGSGEAAVPGKFVGKLALAVPYNEWRRLDPDFALKSVRALDARLGHKRVRIFPLSDHDACYARAVTCALALGVCESEEDRIVSFDSDMAVHPDVVLACCELATLGRVVAAPYVGRHRDQQWIVQLPRVGGVPVARMRLRRTSFGLVRTADAAWCGMGCVAMTPQTFIRVCSYRELHGGTRFRFEHAIGKGAAVNVFSGFSSQRDEEGVTCEDDSSAWGKHLHAAGCTLELLCDYRPGTIVHDGLTGNVDDLLRPLPGFIPREAP